MVRHTYNKADVSNLIKFFSNSSPILIKKYMNHKSYNIENKQQPHFFRLTITTIQIIVVFIV